MIPVVKCQFELIFCFLTYRKCYFFQLDKATSEIAMFEVLDGILNLFWSSVLGQNPIWLKPKKR